MSDEAVPILTSEEEDYDAQVVPTEDIFVDSTDVKTEQKAAEPEATPAPEATPTAEAKPEWLDPKFKTVEDQAKSYREAELRMQKALSEVNEQRKLIDAYILNGIQNNPNLTPAQKTEAKASVFASQLGLDDGQVQDSIIQMLAPVLKPLYDEVAKVRGQVQTDTVRESVKAANSDHFEVVNSPEFAEFAMKSFPVNLLRTADSDPEIAAFVVSKFKESRKPPEQPPVVPVASKPQFTESAKVQSASGDKIFSRAQLIRMQSENPQKYMELQSEIVRAYAENRVR